MPTITKASILAWLGQKTTILGIAGLVGIGAGYETGELTTTMAVTLIAPALVAIIMPESAGGQSDAAKLAKDTLQMVAAKGTGGTPLLVAADALQLAGDLHPSTLVVPVTTSPAPAAS